MLEVIPTKADYVLDLIRMNSLWPLLSGLACCAIEMMSAATSKNDMDRWGMFPFRASPRQADVLIVAGTLTTKMAGPLVRLWEQMPEPKWCVAMGDCTCSGGRYKRSYSTVEGIDRVMPVDVYVPGCPPRPEGLIYGMMKLQQLVKDRRGHWPERAIGPTVPERGLSRGPRVQGAASRRRFGEQLTGPVRQRHDETEIRIGAGRRDPGHDARSTTSRSSASSSSPTSPASTPATAHAGRLPPLERDDAGLAAGHRRRPVARRPARARRSRSCGRAPSGWSARPTTCSASRSRATATCAGSTCRPTTRASRCARTSTCPTTRPARRAPASGRMEQTHTPRNAPATATVRRAGA